MIWQLVPQAAKRKLGREIPALQRAAQEGWGRVLAAFLRGKFFHASSKKPGLDRRGGELAECLSSSNLGATPKNKSTET